MNPLKTSGIYKVVSKLFPSKCYIGSSANLYKRKSDHLKTKKSHNKIQFHADKYGHDDLEFVVLKRCDIDSLLYWEQYYISELNPCFNSHKFASRRGNAKQAMNQAYTDINEDISGRHHDWNLVPFEHIIRDICNRDKFPEILIPL